jgi:hypothetical protein
MLREISFCCLDRYSSFKKSSRANSTFHCYDSRANRYKWLKYKQLTCNDRFLTVEVRWYREDLFGTGDPPGVPALTCPPVVLVVFFLVVVVVVLVLDFFTVGRTENENEHEYD